MHGSMACRAYRTNKRVRNFLITKCQEHRDAGRALEIILIALGVVQYPPKILARQ